MKLREGWDMKAAGPVSQELTKRCAWGLGKGVFPIRRMRHVYLVG